MEILGQRQVQVFHILMSQGFSLLMTDFMPGPAVMGYIV
jgi:hypothetical protein